MNRIFRRQFTVGLTVALTIMCQLAPDCCRSSSAVAASPGTQPSTATTAPSTTRASFDLILWDRSDPHTHLLYLVITDPEAHKAWSKIVAPRVADALAIARQYPDNPVAFNIVFLVRTRPDERMGVSSGFSIQQLEELAQVERAEAERIVDTHHRGLGSLPDH